MSCKNIKLDQQDKLNNTALHYAMEDNNLKLALELIKIGADYNIKNEDGKVCFDLIQDQDVKNIILSYIENKDK